MPRPVSLVLSVVLVPALLAQSPASDTGRHAAAPPPAPLALRDTIPVATHHVVAVHGQSLPYTAWTGMLPIRDDKTRDVEGSMYYVAYTKDGTNAATRPLTFIFNGGPGSSSVWLHLGAFGPKRVHLMPDGSAPPPPYTFEDNPYTLLDQTDMVFIDPVGTGYSRAAKQELGAKFFGLDEDLRSVAEFIRLYLTRFDRMGSPKFLAGESYGTTRAAGLSGVLANNGIALNGVVLISTILNFGYASQARGNDLGFINFLPTYTATAWYHHKLPDDLQRLTVEQAAARSLQWADSGYAAALMQGNRLGADARRETAAQLARYTGLPSDVIEQNDLRVNLFTFDQELLRGSQRTVGRLDTRFTSFNALLASGGGSGQTFIGDPSEASIRNTFTPVFTDYVRRELNYRSDDVYYILGGGIGPWKFPQNQYATVVPNLERAFARNPFMQLFVAEGYYDAATPYAAVDYTLSHISVDPSVLSHNITVKRYEAGHMVYIDDPSAKQMRADLAAFYERALHPAVP